MMSKVPEDKPPVDLRKRIEEVLKRHGIRAEKRHVDRFIKNISPISHVLSPQLLEALVLENLTIGESYFFRDIQTFDKLRKVLKEKPSWNVLSIGCSRGEEVYSTAIVCNEVGVECRIKGIDVNFQRITQARKGCYQFWSVRFLSKEDIERYFNIVDGQYCIKDVYKKNVEFIHGNILDTGTEIFGTKEKFDIIFTRRVLLYIDNLEPVIHKISSLLKDDGFLILGAGEYFPEVLEHFTPAFADVGTFYRKVKLKHDETHKHKGFLSKTRSEKTKINFQLDTRAEPSDSSREYTQQKVQHQPKELEIVNLLKKTIDGIDLEERIRLIEEYITGKSYDRAYELIKESCKKYPTNYVLWKYRTLVELENSDLESAKNSLQRAIFLNSADDEIWQLKHALDFRTKFK